MNTPNIPKLITCAMRMVHIENIPLVLRHGLVCPGSPLAQGVEYRQIGDDAIIGKRRKIKMPDGRSVGDCVPFYLGPRTPMLYRLQCGNLSSRQSVDDIIYCIIVIEDVAGLDHEIFYTDGNATSRATTFYRFENIEKLNEDVSVKDVYCRDWGGDDVSLRCRKQAELLVEGDIPPEKVAYFAVRSDDAKMRLTSLGADEGRVYVRKDFYF